MLSISIINKYNTIQCNGGQMQIKSYVLRDFSNEENPTIFELCLSGIALNIHISLIILGWLFEKTYQTAQYKSTKGLNKVKRYSKGKKAQAAMGTQPDFQVSSPGSFLDYPGCA